MALFVAAGPVPARFADPLAELNTTPLIDVLLVLMIVFILSIPIASHTLPVDLPRPCIDCTAAPANPVVNKITVDEAGTIFWNGAAIDQPRLARTLAATRTMPVEPELQYEPAADASYAVSVEVIRLIRASGVTKFGFVGNDRYRQFSSGA